jgi:hypothetical protein
MPIDPYFTSTVKGEPMRPAIALQYLRKRMAWRKYCQMCFAVKTNQTKPTKGEKKCSST